MSIWLLLKRTVEPTKKAKLIRKYNFGAMTVSGRLARVVAHLF